MVVIEDRTITRSDHSTAVPHVHQTADLSHPSHPSHQPNQNYYRAPYTLHQPLHPIHGVLLAGTIPLFLGALLSDIAYGSSQEVQWSNFSSWLIAGALIFTGLALLCSLGGLFRRNRVRRPAVTYSLLLLATWVFGFLNALVHARDAWAIMPAGLILSAIVAILALLATGFGFCAQRTGGEQ